MKWLRSIFPRMRENIQFQFVLSYLLIIGVVLLLLNTYPVLASESLVFQSKRSILTEGQMIASNLSEMAELDADGVRQVVSPLVENSRLNRIVVTDSSARILFDSQPGASKRKYALFQELVRALDGKDVFHSSFQNNAFRSEAAVPVTYFSTVIGAVYLYEYDSQQAEILQGLRANLRSITLVVWVFAVLVSVLLSRIVTRRMNHLLSAIRTFRRGEYSHHITLRGRDQLAKMADEFNRMSEQIQETDEMRRQFVADASHELKTPLTSIRLLSDSILQQPDMDPALTREFVSDIGRETERLSRITEELLSLARLDRGLPEHIEAIDISLPVRGAIHLLLPLAEREDIVLHTELPSGCQARISSDDMAHIANNLIENAIKYNVPGGSVWVTLAIDEEDVVLTVEDTGIGIPPEDRERVFERFYRVDKARSREAGGTGLGLSIVRDTVLRADGSVRLEEREGGGSRFRVTLPLAREVDPS